MDSIDHAVAPWWKTLRGRLSPRTMSLLRWAVCIAVYLVLLRRWWPAPPFAIFQGLILGSLLALVAFAVGLVHRASGIVNMAQADMGVVPGAVFSTLLLTKGWSYWPSLAFALVVAALLGMAVQVFLRTFFANTPRMVLMVATIGLGQFLFGLGTSVPEYLQRISPRRGGFGSNFGDYMNAWSAPIDWHVTIGLGTYNGNDLLALALPILVLPLIHLFMHRTRSGLALRAGAENGTRTSMLGINLPRVHLMVWAIAAILATLSLILRAGMFGLPRGSLFGPRYMVLALAMAFIGRMQHFGVMFAASIGYGVIESSTMWNSDQWALDGVLLAVVIIAMLTQPRRERAVDDGATSTWREAAVAKTLPKELARMWIVRIVPWLLWIPVVIVIAPLSWKLNAGQVMLITDIMLICIVGVSLVIFTGWAGQISLGHFVFVAAGGVFGAWVISGTNADLLIAVVVGGGAAAVFAASLAYILRRRTDGLSFALLTLILCVAVPFLLVSETYIPQLRGILPDTSYWGIDRNPVLGRFSLYWEEEFFVLASASLAAVLLVARNLQRSRTARVTIAGRENRRAATAFGLDVLRTRMTALAVSGFFAGFAGVLLTVHRRHLPADLWDPGMSFRLISSVVIGGASSVVGGAIGIGALFATFWFSAELPQRLQRFILYGLGGGGMVVVLAVVPGGAAGFMIRLRNLLLRPIARWKGIELPSPGRRVHLVPAVLSMPGRLFRRFVPVPLPVGRPATGILEVRDVTARYGPVQVLFGIDLDVPEGGIFGLLGTNGSGKSTLLNAITGTVDATGSVRFRGREISGMAPHRITRLGIVQAPGGRGTFPSLTVRQHLSLAAVSDNWRPRRRAASIEAALTRFPALHDKLDRAAGTLSKGEQQMLTLAMALVNRPRVLLIDELSLGLAPSIIDQLLEIVRDLRDEGMTIVLVEQSVDTALRVADEVCFLEQGELRFRGPAEELRERPDLLRAVFLHQHDDVRVVAPVAPAAPSGVPVLATAGLQKRFGATVAADDVSVTVNAGEIVGIIGPNGAGKTTVLDIISGFTPADGGAVLVDGRDVLGDPPHTRARHGIARSIQDARLFGALTCHETVMVALDIHLQGKGVIPDALRLRRTTRAAHAAEERADELLSMLGLAQWRDWCCEELSTGTRRVLDLACQLAIEPRVILLDEPSSGMAQREAEALVPLLRRVRDETGTAMLVIEHNIPVVTELTDRLVAMHLGRVVAEGLPADVLAHPLVEEAYLGRAPQDALPFATL